MEWVTTAATVVLVATAWLAYRSNRKLIAATQAQLEVARDALDRSTEQLNLARDALDRQQEPCVVPADPDGNHVGDPIETHAGPQTFRTRRVYIGIENAGPGLALISKAEVASSERGTFNVWWPPALPAGMQRALKLTPSGGTVLDPPAGETFKVSLEYAGADGALRILRFTAQVYPGNDWVVHIVPTDETT
jgi:hypothetical protein